MQQELDKIWTGWELGPLLGEGSFGKVYRIEREEFGYKYEAALKVITIPRNQAEIKSALSDGMDEKSVTMYFRSIVEDIVKEFMLMSKLKGNTNIVSYEDHAVVPHKEGIGWTIYIRMELLTPLLDHLLEHGLVIRDVIQLGIDMCKALEICQRYNIIHRDIKPENIFISELGQFKLGDFGIARQMEKTSSALSRKGTYTYMAPEIFKGEAYNSTVDIYSLGVVLYRFLNNNRAPFLPAYPQPIKHSDKEMADVLHMSGARMDPPCNAEGRLAEIVLKACAFDPKERYESPVDMRHALESVLYEAREAKWIYPQGDELKNERIEYVTSSLELGITAHPEAEEKTKYLFGSFVDEEKTELYSGGLDTSDPKIASGESEKTEKRDGSKEYIGQSDEAAEGKAVSLFPESQEGKTEERKDEIIILREANEEKISVQAEDGKGESQAHKGEETKEKAGKSGKKGKRIIIAGVLAVGFLAAGCCTVYWLQQKALERKVPYMVNMNLESAIQEAAGEDHSLQIVEAGSVYSDQVEKGRIVTQNIEAETVVKKGDKIEVILSKGALVEVPQLAGMPSGEAEKAANQAGLGYQITGETYSDELQAGAVISQDLEAGSKAEEQQVISVVVSKGAEPATVPDVTGKSLDEAAQALREAKLDYATSEAYSEKVEKGLVVSQGLEGGTQVEKNTQVDLVVSLGQEPKPEPEPEKKSPADNTEKKNSISSKNKKSSAFSKKKSSSSGKKSSSSKKSSKKKKDDTWELELTW